MKQSTTPSKIRKATATAARFRRDQRGMEAVQIIMTIAIAAMVCLGVSKVSGVNSTGASNTGIMGTITEIGGSFLGDKVGSIFGN